VLRYGWDGLRLSLLVVFVLFTRKEARFNAFINIRPRGSGAKIAKSSFCHSESDYSCQQAMHLNCILRTSKPTYIDMWCSGKGAEEFILQEQYLLLDKQQTDSPQELLTSLCAFLEGGSFCLEICKKRLFGRVERV
jgi:hypothetical protein